MCSFNQNDINVWDNVWKEDVYSKPELRSEKATIKVDKLLDHIGIGSATTVLDLGCGGGYVARELFSKTAAHIYGIDSSEKAINLAIELSKGTTIKFEKADVTKLPIPDDFADVVLCIGVIEHVQDHEKCLEEIKRVLKRNGYVYVVSSNRDSFIYEQRIMRERLGLWNYGYQKNWTKAELESIFLRKGFSTQFIETDSGIGNFKIIDKLDKFFSTSVKKRGRYIYYVGRIEK